MILASTSKGFSMFSPFQDGGADSAIKNLAIFIALPGLLMMVAIDLIGTFLVWAYAKIRVRVVVLLGYRAVLESRAGVASGFGVAAVDLLGDLLSAHS